MKGFVYIGLLTALVFTSCKKESEIIPGNEAMSDPTVSLTQIRQFVQKVYLATEGVSPGDSLMDAEIRALALENCSNSSRAAFVDKLMYTAAAKSNYYNIRNEQLLDGASAEDINNVIEDLQFEISDPANAVDVTRLRLELSRMEALRDAKQQFIDGTINLIEVEKRMTSSVLFSWANGSGETWVESVFGFFLLRMPLDEELDNVTSMMYGNPGVLFLQTGTSDTDFFNIFFSSRSFCEGQVREIFRNLIFREPTTAELLDYTNWFVSHKNHLTTMRKLFLSNEFLRGY